MISHAVFKKALKFCLILKDVSFATEIDAKKEYAINKRRVEIDLISRKKRLGGGWGGHLIT